MTEQYYSTKFVFAKGDTRIDRHRQAQYYGFRYDGFFIFPALDGEDCKVFTISFSSERARTLFENRDTKTP